MRSLQQPGRGLRRSMDACCFAGAESGRCRRWICQRPLGPEVCVSILGLGRLLSIFLTITSVPNLLMAATVRLSECCVTAAALRYQKRLSRRFFCLGGHSVFVRLDQPTPLQCPTDHFFGLERGSAGQKKLRCKIIRTFCITDSEGGSCMSNVYPDHT